MQHLTHKNTWTNRNKDNAFLLDENKKSRFTVLVTTSVPEPIPIHPERKGICQRTRMEKDCKKKKERNSNVKVIFYFWKKGVSQREIVCSCGMAFMSDDSWKFRLGVLFPVILIQNRRDCIKMERFFPHGKGLCVFCSRCIWQISLVFLSDK